MAKVQSVPVPKCLNHVDSNGVQLCDGHGLFCPEPTLTQQEFARDCDIDSILERARRSGVINLDSRVPQFGDFSNVPSYQEMHDRVIAAQAAFDSLDWKVKERFHNDPGELISFLSDEANTDEAIKLGLAVAKPAAAATPPASPPANGGDVVKP